MTTAGGHVGKSDACQCSELAQNLPEPRARGEKNTLPVSAEDEAIQWI